MTIRPILLMFPLLLAACQVPDAAPSGAYLYARHCASCHGANLDGNGPLAGQLGTAPPDLTLLSERNGGRFPMMEVLTQIHGYPGRYHRGAMPEFAPGLSSASADWTDADGQSHPVPRDILELARYLEAQQE